MKLFRFASLFTFLLSTLALASSNPVPLINQPLVPASAKPASEGFTLTVNGTGFDSNSVVYWNGSSRVTELVSSTQLKATITSADVATAGTASVKVVSAPPGKGISNIVFFPIRYQAPALNLLETDYTIPVSSFGVVGDFNNDGKLDVALGVIAKHGGTIYVYLGNGDGTFKAPIKVPSKVAPGRMAVADFNGDGKLDLVVAGHYTHEVAVFLGKGDGTFTEKPSFMTNSSIHIDAVAPADFNGDGKLDLFVGGSNDTGSGFEIYLGNGDGTFNPTATFSGSPSGNPAIADFNGDGVLDIAIADQGSGEVWVSLGKGDGTFGSPVAYGARFGASFAVAAADMNGDGKVDLVTDGVSVLIGNGNGTFQDSDDGFAIGPSAYNVDIGDFNGDGIPDVALLSAGHIAVLLGNGNGSVQPPLFTNYASNGYVLGMGDFTGSGLLDLLTVGKSGLAVFVQTPAVLTPTGINFGNQGVGSRSAPQIVVLANANSSTLPIKGITISGADHTSFNQTNNCGTTLPAGGNCKIKVTFAPKQEGQRNASLDVSYQGFGSLVSAALAGSGVVPAAVSVKPSDLKFSTQLIDTASSAQIVTVSNTGDQTVNITNIAATAPFSETNNCPSALPTQASCQIQVEFTPSKPGAVEGKLTLTDNAKDSPQKVALSGIGTVMQFSVEGVNFGNQQVDTKSSPAPIKVTNIGASAVSISKIAITGADAADFVQTSNCGHSLPAKGSCTIKVTFDPKAKGQRSAVLGVTDDGGGSPQKLSLEGAGT